MTIKELIDLANKYIDDGASVHLNETIDHSLVLRVFKGSQWTGGEWEKVAVARWETQGIDPQFISEKKFEAFCREKGIEFEETK